MPRWIVVLAIVLAIAGAAAGAALASPRTAAAGAPPAAGGTFATADPDLGRRTYVFCQGCHGADGRGVPGYAPGLAGSRWLVGDPRAAILIVLHGYDATAEATAGYVSARMLGHGQQLADHEIAAVLSWARSQWGNAAPAVDPAMVARLRLRHAARSAPWTPAELRALPPEP